MNSRVIHSSLARTVARTLVLLVLPLCSLQAEALEEAPTLAARVTAGKLPGLSQRLPDKPEIITPLHTGGRYGGTLRSGLLADGDQNGILRFVARGLLRWDAQFDHPIPDIAESWQSNAEANEFTFRLRRGMYWSDGVPFNADDIVFAVNDVLGNKALFKTVPDRYQTAGRLMRAEKIDDLTVRIHFAAGNRSFPEELAGPYGHHPVIYPRHYCGRFHADTNQQAPELARQAGFTDWPALFNQRCSDYFARWSNPEKPTLDPWVVTQPYVVPAKAQAGEASQVILQRNPYFWQIDTQGRQLPYIDAIRFDVLPSQAALLDATATGRFDLQIRGVGGVQAAQQLASIVASGTHAWLRLPDVNASAVGLYLNHTTTRLRQRVLFRSVRFKSALSMGIDREEIARQVFLGEVKPWQIGTPVGHRFHDARLAMQYTRFDPDAANAILDTMLPTRRDAEGFRLIGGGIRLSLKALVNNNATTMLDTLALIRRSWAKLGIELIIDAVDRSENMSRAKAGDYDISVDVVSGGLDPAQNPRAYLTVHPSDSRQGLPWVRWYDSQGTLGEEPPPAMQRRLQLWDRWKAATTQAEADKLFREILTIAAEEFRSDGHRHVANTGRRTEQQVAGRAGQHAGGMDMADTQSLPTATILLRRLTKDAGDTR